MVNTVDMVCTDDTVDTFTIYEHTIILTACVISFCRQHIIGLRSFMKGLDDYVAIWLG